MGKEDIPGPGMYNIDLPVKPKNLNRKKDQFFR